MRIALTFVAGLLTTVFVVNAGDALLHIGMDDHCKLDAAGEE